VLEPDSRATRINAGVEIVWAVALAVVKERNAENLLMIRSPELAGKYYRDIGKLTLGIPNLNERPGQGD
jgi:hypothetical protein